MIETGSRVKVTLDWLANETGNGDWKSVGGGDGVDGKLIRMADCSQEHWESTQIEIFLTVISDSPLYANDIKRL